MRSLREVIWSLLPDCCQVSGCPKHGMRGNENLVPIGTNGKAYVIMCDDCTSAHYIRYTERDIDSERQAKQIATLSVRSARLRRIVMGQSAMLVAHGVPFEPTTIIPKG